MTDNTQADQDPTENIEIFSTDDEKIKSIGELLTNDSSRTILQLLFKEEMTATQLAQKTGTSLQLVKYHLNKMQDVGVVRISKIEKNTKAQDMKYYKATKFAIVILPSKISDKTKESKLLLHSFKTIYRFAGIGVAAIASWFATRTLQGARQISQTVSEQNAQLTPVEPQTEPLKAPEHGPAVPASEPESPAVSGQEESTESTFQSGESKEPSSVETEPSTEAPQSSDQTLDFAQTGIGDDSSSSIAGIQAQTGSDTIIDVILQFLVPIVVISIGVIIELYLRSRKHKIENRSAIK